MESECGDIRKDRKNRSSLRLEKHLIGEKESSCPLTIVDAGSDFVVDSTSTKWGLNTQLGDSLCPFIFIPSVSVSSSGSFPLPPIQAGHPRNRSFFRLRAPSPFLGIFAHSRQLTTVFLILSLTLQLLCSLATASPMVPISGDGEEGSKPTAKDGSLIHVRLVLLSLCTLTLCLSDMCCERVKAKKRAEKVEDSGKSFVDNQD